uniref:Uncharacterized protein n=1 Tax=Amphimedon queenslandica TaxID=400682 RepID=A0A1X7VKA7_AMPQE
MATNRVSFSNVSTPTRKRHGGFRRGSGRPRSNPDSLLVKISIKKCDYEEMKALKTRLSFEFDWQVFKEILNLAKQGLMSGNDSSINTAVNACMG